MNEKPYKMYKHNVFDKFYITHGNDFLYYKNGLSEDINWVSFRRFRNIPPKVNAYIKDMTLIRDMSEEEFFLELL